MTETIREKLIDARLGAEMAVKILRKALKEDEDDPSLSLAIDIANTMANLERAGDALADACRTLLGAYQPEGEEQR